MDPRRVIVYGTIVVLSVAVVQPRRPLRVVGQSMSPTYADGEWLSTLPVDRPLRRGDVIVFHTAQGTMMKRVALIPGDKHLEFRTPLGWADALNTRRPNPNKPNSHFRYAAVPEDSVFVLGDHLSNSIDSRDYGVVKLSNIIRIVEDRRAPSPRSEIAQKEMRRWTTAV